MVININDSKRYTTRHEKETPPANNKMKTSIKLKVITNKEGKQRTFFEVTQ